MKKTQTQSYRLSEQDKQRLLTVADTQKTEPAKLVSTLIEQYLDAFEQHGKRLVWPPEFNYFTNPETEIEAQTKRDALEKAG